MKNILYPIASQDGVDVFITEAEPGGRYECVACHTRMVARKGAKVVHHFAHYHRPDSCGGESVLHLLGKRLLMRYLSKSVDVGAALPLQHGDHTSLFQLDLRSGDTIREEYAWNYTRCDVVVLRKGHTRPSYIFEVIVTHPPDKDTAEIYEAEGILVVAVRPRIDSLRRIRLTFERLFNTECDGCVLDDLAKKCVVGERMIADLSFHNNRLKSENDHQKSEIVNHNNALSSLRSDYGLLKQQLYKAQNTNNDTNKKCMDLERRLRATGLDEVRRERDRYKRELDQTRDRIEVLETQKQNVLRDISEYKHRELGLERRIKDLERRIRNLCKEKEALIEEVRRRGGNWF